MLTTAGAAFLMTGAKEGSCDWAKTGAETANAATARPAARVFFMGCNLDGARCLTGAEADKFRCARALFFRGASASAHKLRLFCAIFAHTRCCVARKWGVPGDCSPWHRETA